MNPVFIWIATSCYIIASLQFLYQKKWSEAFIFIGYSIANIGVLYTTVKK